MAGMDDPRVHEFRAALAATNAGLQAARGSNERYRKSLLPYVECIAELTPDEPPYVRKYMMAALYDDGLPLGPIALGFKANEDELAYVRERPPVEPEPVDEQERLASLPYGVYLKSAHWQQVRKDALTRAGNRCSLCNSDSLLQVHRRTYERRGAERPGDVVVLCDSCHGRHHDALKAA